MWELLAGLFVWTLVGGVVPIVNAELMVVVTSVAATGVGAPLVVLTATVGQMIAKTGLFLTARWAPTRLPRRAQDALDRGHQMIEGRGGATASLIFVSAALGLPPFYVVSLAAGAVRVDWKRFVVLGTAGRALRFGVLSWAALRFGEEALRFLR